MSQTSPNWSMIERLDNIFSFAMAIICKCKIHNIIIIIIIHYELYKGKMFKMKYIPQNQIP